MKSDTGFHSAIDERQPARLGIDLEILIWLKSEKFRESIAGEGAVAIRARVCHAQHSTHETGSIAPAHFIKCATVSTNT